MTMKKTIELAAKLLSNSYGYVGGEHGLCGAFDFRVDKDGIDVFNADFNDMVFFWPEVVIHIVDALGLSSYVTIGSNQEGQAAIVMRIY